MYDDFVIYITAVLCGGMLGKERETAAFNKEKHSSSSTGIASLKYQIPRETRVSFTVNLLIEVHS